MRCILSIVALAINCYAQVSYEECDQANKNGKELFQNTFYSSYVIGSDLIGVLKNNNRFLELHLVSRNPLRINIGNFIADGSGHKHEVDIEFTWSNPTIYIRDMNLEPTLINVLQDSFSSMSSDRRYHCINIRESLICCCIYNEPKRKSSTIKPQQSTPVKQNYELYIPQSFQQLNQ